MTSLVGRRIELWVEPRGAAPAVNPVMRRLLDDLRSRRAAVSVRIVEHDPIDLMHLPDEPSPDLVLLKTATSLGLSRALADEASGVRFLNGARATWRASDKAATVARLAAAGLPVPVTFLGGGTRDVRGRSPSLAGSWVTKPVYGVHGRGVVVHPAFPSAIETPAVPDAPGSLVIDDGTLLVQQRIGDDEVDVKVYVANGQCFAGRKGFDRASYASDDIEPYALDRASRDAVLAAGETLGLRCFGVDLRFRGLSPVIIDVNPFPGYRGFPAAVPALRFEIERRLEVPES